MKDNNKGFSGLEGLSTNIDDILEEAAKNDKKKKRNHLKIVQMAQIRLENQTKKIRINQVR